MDPSKISLKQIYRPIKVDFIKDYSQFNQTNHSDEPVYTISKSKVV